MERDRDRGLADEVTRAFRVVIAGAAAVALILAGSLIWLVAFAQPRSSDAGRAVTLSNDLQGALLNEESAIRAYLVAPDPILLVTFRTAQARVAADEHGLVTLSNAIPRSRLDALVAADRRWQTGWVAQAEAPATRSSIKAANGELRLGPLAAFISSGRASFTAVTESQRAVLAAATVAQSRERRTDVILLAVVFAVLLMIGAGVAVTTLRRRNQLRVRVVAPIDLLLEKVRAVGRGEFGAAPMMTAPAELLELRDELSNMSGSLRLQQEALASRAADVSASNRRLKMVLAFAREVSETPTLARSLAVVATAARRFAEAPRARVWLVEEGGRSLTLQHDSITGELVPFTSRSIGYGGLGQAAQTHRVCLCDGLAGETEPAVMRSTALAVPMLKGPRLVGVIEILLLPGVTEPKPELIELLEAMAAQAATAIDAALMYALTESLSLSDPLTGLANRRQLDRDLMLEIERSARHARPLSFFMLDIDHFKRVNDTFGHAVGDAVLVEVAHLLAEQMRAGDTVYRYGGEEFAVLARDTDSHGAVVVAERLRRVVEQRYATKAKGDLSVTISVGIAELGAALDTADLIVAAADAALYAAKRNGRNRVEVAGRITEVRKMPRVTLAT